MPKNSSFHRALFIPSLNRYVEVSQKTIDSIDSIIKCEPKGRFTHFLKCDVSDNGPSKCFFFEIKTIDNEKKEF